MRYNTVLSYRAALDWFIPVYSLFYPNNGAENIAASSIPSTLPGAVVLNISLAHQGIHILFYTLNLKMVFAYVSAITPNRRRHNFVHLNEWIFNIGVEFTYYFWFAACSSLVKVKVAQIAYRVLIIASYCINDRLHYLTIRWWVYRLLKCII